MRADRTGRPTQQAASSGQSQTVRLRWGRRSGSTRTPAVRSPRSAGRPDTRRDGRDPRRTAHNPSTYGSVGGSVRVGPSTPMLDCLGHDRRVKAKPHAVASRALTQRLRPEGRQLSRRTGQDQGTAISTGRTAVRRAISGPLTPVTKGLSRSLADTPPRRSEHVTGPDGTDSQADSAGSIPVTRSNVKVQVGEPFRTLGLRSFRG
jgi:hypothetical protein